MTLLSDRVRWIADDYAYYEPDSSGSLPDPQLVFDVYKGEFDAAYEEHSLFILMLHPHITGTVRGSRRSTA